MASGLDAVVNRYDAYGPLAAAFLANLLATFGDKGQLVVVTLASRYDAEKVFAGAVGAFAVWSAVEVTLGQWIVSVISEQVMTLLTGAIFLAFGAWTLWTAAGHFREEADGASDAVVLTGGGIDVGLSGRVLPDVIVENIGRYGGVVTTFAFIMFAEFGDKTQALTITLSGTFPDAPLAVYVGVVSALALRTGLDALIGERFERWIPTRWMELVAAVVFVAFGLVVLGLLPEAALLAVLAGVAALVVVAAARKFV